MHDLVQHDSRGEKGGSAWRQTVRREACMRQVRVRRCCIAQSASVPSSIHTPPSRAARPFESGGARWRDHLNKTKPLHGESTRGMARASVFCTHHDRGARSSTVCRCPAKRNLHAAASSLVERLESGRRVDEVDESSRPQGCVAPRASSPDDAVRGLPAVGEDGADVSARGATADVLFGNAPACV